MTRILLTILFVLMLTSFALAEEATVQADKQRVNPGETVTISGDLGNGTFEYRGACVAPSRVVIHDTGRLQTDNDGSFSFTCAIPTLDNISAQGVPAVSTRAVIPIVVGVAFNDSGEIKKVHDVVFIVNTNKLSEKLSGIEDRVRRAVARVEGAIARADSLIQKANASGGARAVENLERLKAHLAEFKNAGSALLAKISEAGQTGGMKSLRELLREFEGSFRNAEKYTRLSQDELARTPEKRGGGR